MFALTPVTLPETGRTYLQQETPGGTILYRSGLPVAIRPHGDLTCYGADGYTDTGYRMDTLPSRTGLEYGDESPWYDSVTEWLNTFPVKPRHHSAYVGQVCEEEFFEILEEFQFVSSDKVARSVLKMKKKAIKWKRQQEAHNYAEAIEEAHAEIDKTFIRNALAKR